MNHSLLVNAVETNAFRTLWFTSFWYFSFFFIHFFLFNWIIQVWFWYINQVFNEWSNWLIMSMVCIWHLKWMSEWMMICIWFYSPYLNTFCWINAFVSFFIFDLILNHLYLFVSSFIWLDQSYISLFFYWNQNTVFAHNLRTLPFLYNCS